MFLCLTSLSWGDYNSPNVPNPRPSIVNDALPPLSRLGTDTVALSEIHKDFWEETLVFLGFEPGSGATLDPETPLTIVPAWEKAHKPKVLMGMNILTALCPTLDTCDLYFPSRSALNPLTVWKCAAERNEAGAVSRISAEFVWKNVPPLPVLVGEELYRYTSESLGAAGFSDGH